MLVAIPMLVLFEGSVLLSSLIEKRKKKKAAVESEEDSDSIENE